MAENAYFNSFMVRLKVIIHCVMHYYNYHFNSFMVRLKAKITGKYVANVSFQFLHGAINRALPAIKYTCYARARQGGAVSQDEAYRPLWPIRKNRGGCVSDNGLFLLAPCPTKFLPIRMRDQKCSIVGLKTCGYRHS